MKFSDTIIKYLNGDNFSEGLTVPISKLNDELINRKDLMIRIIKNKKIIHLGCCDHKLIINDKIKDNSWLHKHLVDNSEFCLGIDINKDAVNYVTEELGYKNIIYGDITDDNKIHEIENNKFDIMVMGEILEHIDNPVLFLQKIRINYKNNINQILISVPNAFSYRNFVNLKKHTEILNTDHRYWFSPFTLAKIAVKAGYKISDFYFTDEIRKKVGKKAKLLLIPYIKWKIKYYRLYKYPALRINLVMVIDL